MWERVNTSVFSNSFQTLALTVGTSHKLSAASTSGRTFKKDPDQKIGPVQNGSFTVIRRGLWIDDAFFS